MKKFIALATTSVLMAACAQNGQGGYGGGGYGNSGGGLNKEIVGGLAGAAGGAALGAQFGKGKGQLVGVALGTLLGAKLGSEAGASLDRADMTYYNQTSQQALETAQPGQALPWKNPQSGNYGTITPSNYYQGSGGQYCREYSQSISVGGQVSQGYGTACRQQDGTWQIVQ
jgi:surface antigen